MPPLHPVATTHVAVVLLNWVWRGKFQTDDASLCQAAPMDLPVTTCTSTIHEDWCVVGVRGDLDAGSAPAVDAAVDAGLAMPQAPRGVIVDLRECPFVDSSGISVLVMGHKHAREANVILAVVASQPRVLRVLEMTGVDVVIPLYETLDAAMA